MQWQAARGKGQGRRTLPCPFPLVTCPCLQRRPMPVEITMPQLSDTMTEGTVVKWRKKEGDKVAAGETIAEIETDKATMEQEAYDGGTLAAIVVPEGQKVKVGDLIAVLAGAGEKLEDIRK